MKSSLRATRCAGWLRVFLLAGGLLILGFPGGLRAHEDTIITLKGTALVGLPKTYAPAEFDTKTYRLRIGKHAMTLPPVLKRLFAEPHDLQWSASWYHTRSTLPPYLDLRIRPKDRDFRYNILYNLETLDVIDLSRTIFEPGGFMRDVAVPLSAEDKAAIRKAIETLP